MNYTQPTEQLERLSASVERVAFHSPETGFCVLRVWVPGKQDLVTVIGNAASVNAGEYLECVGSWFVDKKHGLQFKSQSLSIALPSTLEGIERYLSSGMVEGIGVHFAKVLIDAFGLDIFDVIENHPEKLRRLPGIGRKRVNQICVAWAEQKVIRDIMVFLQSYGLGTARAVRIFKTYGVHSIAKVTENPYRLTLDIHGIGFKIADELAFKLGIPRDSMIRAEAGIAHVLKEHSNNGHCAAPMTELLETAQALLDIPKEVLEEAVQLAIGQKTITREDIDGVDCVFLTPLYLAEVGIAQNINRLMEEKLPWGVINTNVAIPIAETKNHITLSGTQKKALELALNSKVTIITGGPGVGKTTLVNSLLTILRDKSVNIHLCAPTGRAAKRLSESTGFDAKTIHRTLEFDPLTFDFKRNKQNPLIADLVVLDESSMVDVVLMNKLLNAIPDNSAVLFVGDVDQLPAVGPGSCLADLINSGTVPTIRLTEIFRQAAASQIIVNAHRVNNGEMPLVRANNDKTDFYFIQAHTPEQIHKTLMQLVEERIPKSFNLDPINDIQILTPMNKGGLGTKALNIIFQEKLNPHASGKVMKFGTTYSVGDKVIQIINNYDKEVFNGDIGIISSVNNETNELKVLYDEFPVTYSFAELDELSLAYATTIHKSQGSEYPAVVIPLSMQHYTMLERNLIYTAITRGKELVVLVGEPKALGMAINNHRARQRLTGLRQRLSTTVLPF